MLDVGCGVGATTRQVSGSAHPGPVVGLDRSRDLVDRAKSDDASNPANLGFLVGDAMKLPFRDDRFDLAFSQMTLAWVGDAAGAVGEQARVVRPGGLVAAVDVDFDAAVWYPELPAFRETRAAYCRFFKNRGADPYIGRKLYALLTNAGLEGVELQTHAFTAYGAEDETMSNMVAHEVGRLESTGAELADKGLASQPEIEQAVAELKGLLNDPGTMWLGNLFACTGRKP